MIEDPLIPVSIESMVFSWLFPWIDYSLCFHDSTLYWDLPKTQSTSKLISGQIKQGICLKGFVVGQ